MGKRVTLELSDEDRKYLLNISKRSADWRARERAQTLLLLDEGYFMREVAEMVEIDIRTVGLTRMDWLKRGAQCLVDAPRSGAPKKITPEELEKIVEAATNEPLTAKAVLAKHVAAGGKLVHVNTMTKILKKAKFVWKRTRTSLKKKEMSPHSEPPK